MLNYIWLGLVIGAVLIGGWDGRPKEVADKSFEMAEFAVVKTAFPLAVMRRIFSDVPPDHPAVVSMLMNIAANMLGLGNAATLIAPASGFIEYHETTPPPDAAFYRTVTP